MVDGVISIKLFRDDGDGQPGVEVSSFTPSDHTQHFMVEVETDRFGNAIAHWVFTGVETSAGNGIKIGEFDVAGLISNEIYGSLRMRKDWPTGTYRADLFLGKQLLVSFPYGITAA